VSVTPAVSVVGVAGWPVTVDVVEVGVVNTWSLSQEKTLSGTGACVYSAHELAGRGDIYQWASTRGVLVFLNFSMFSLSPERETMG